MILNDVKDRIRGASDIVSIVSGYLKLKKSGSGYKGLCPFHSEKTPSMVVNQDKQVFHCFGCGVGGDVFTFVGMVENLSFFESMEKLGKMAGIAVRSDAPLSEEFKLKSKIFEINKKAALFFSNYLLKTVEGKKGLSYLRGRGISEGVLHEFLIGFAGNASVGLGNYLKKEGYTFEILEEAGLLRKNDTGRYTDRFRNRVIFPIFDSGGDIAGFGGRVLEASEHRPKYLNSPETAVYKKSDILFGLNLARESVKKSGSVIMVEGYMDVIPLHQNGIKNVIATSGTALTRNHVKLLKRFTDLVIMVFDGDQAGQRATVKGYELLEEGGIKVKVISLPDGKDPDDYLKEEGPESFLKLVGGAVSFVDHMIRKSLGENSNITVEGKVACVSKVLPYLKVISNSIEQGYYVSRLAGALKISEKSIYKELEKVRQKTHIDPHKGETRAFDTRFKAEKELLRIMLRDFSKIGVVREKISREEFKDKLISGIVDVLFNEPDIKKIEAGNIVDSMKTEEAKRVVLEYVVSDDVTDFSEECIDDCIRDIRRIGENLPGYWKVKASRLDRQRCLKEQLKEINRVGSGNLIH